MALDRLTRWFGGTPTVPADLANALRDLERLASSRPELEAAARSLGRVLKAAFDPPEPGVETPSSAPFHDAPPPLNSSRFRDRALAIASALVVDNPAAPALVAAIRRRTIDVAAWSAEVLAGRSDAFEDDARARGLDVDLARSVLRLTMLPSLAPLTYSAEPIVGPPGGPCPWCDSPPILAEMRGLEREVRLRCGVCDGDWPGGRVLCVACGETDHHRLATHHAEGEGDRCRVLRCESCGYRLKMVATLARLAPPSLIVADLETIHLDLIDLNDPLTSA